jgi:DNA (cytosine-5)-methyltransferase 1
LKALSLFSGIGGFDLALNRLGIEIIGACEIDKYAREIYSKHFPNVPIHNDVTKLDPADLPDFDLIVGGFPCQAFSIAGNRRGFEDTRGTLFFEIARIAKEKRPRYLLLENVKGLLSHEGGDTLRTIYKVLDELGYDTQARIVNTKNYLPQNRERIFIVCHLRGTSGREVFPITTDDGETNELKQVGYINKNAQGQRVYDPKGISTTLAAQAGGLGAKTGLYNIDTKIRKLTPLECERLQGFPDNWTEGISDTQRYKCCGNAVSVPVVQDIISSLLTK